MTPHEEHLAIAGFAMAWGILGRLHSRGIITTEETVDLLDGAILWLEEIRGQDALVEGTRAVLGELIEHIRRIRPDSNAPPTPDLSVVANANASQSG